MTARARRERESARREAGNRKKIKKTFDAFFRSNGMKPREKACCGAAVAYCVLLVAAIPVCIVFGVADYQRRADEEAGAGTCCVELVRVVGSESDSGSASERYRALWDVLRYPNGTEREVIRGEWRDDLESAERDAEEHPRDSCDECRDGNGEGAEWGGAPLPGSVAWVFVTMLMFMPCCGSIPALLCIVFAFPVEKKGPRYSSIEDDPHPWVPP